jgi:catechol 2,3-dioxygenase-like lactoylglutathione lyase family enzyme
MARATLEHVNITVSDPPATAAWMCRVFGWHIRWEGPGMQTGYTVHVGDTDRYVALFSYGDATPSKERSYTHVGGLNHLAVVVDDLDAMEELVTAEGFTPTNHSDYEPGRRFYFHDRDGIEVEVVSYAD